MFENKLYEGIYYSRFVASFCNSGGKLGWAFRNWLEQLVINGKRIPDDIVDEIYNYGTNGKLELETNARMFLK